MRKKLTINTLAIGNLKHRRKQYAIMIVGILLAMIFSSSMLFFVFSLNASQQEMKKNLYGNQNIAFFEANEGVVKEAYDKGVIEDYGFAHELGYAYVDSEELGASVAWADERFKSIQYQLLLEGEYPTSDNEIAAEKSALVRLGIEPKLGAKVKVKLKVQDGMKYIENPVEKEYTVVGILKDKKSNITKYYYSGDDNIKYLPAVFVSENTLVESGGKENLISYIRIKDAEDIWNEKSDFYKFFRDKGFSTDESNHFYQLDSKWLSSGLGELSNRVGFAVVLAIVLLVASGLIIINSFNANLKERKKQIGMLRAVGTTRRQIIQIFSREALIISLLCAPVSLVISLFGVKLIAKLLFDENFVFIAKWWILIVCIVFSVFAVMLAALIPLISASKITPMQAIRNIDTARKLRNKKIKTQKQFKTESLLAKRNEALHRGSRFAVIFILIITIVISCVGFTFLKEEYTTGYKAGYDYEFWGIEDGAWYSDTINYTDGVKGFTDNDRQEIQSFPYIKYAEGAKSAIVNLVLPEYNDYFEAFAGDYSPLFMYNGIKYPDDEWRMPTTKDEWEKYTSSKEDNEEYTAIKQRFNIQGEYYPSNVIASSPAVVEELKDIVSEGKIDISKLNTGEEIILIAPKRAAFYVKEDKRYEAYYSSTDTDNNIKADREYFVEGELPYRVGDKITLDVLTASSPDYDDESVYNMVPADLKQESREVTIGAIITSSDFSDTYSALHGGRYWNDIQFITTNQGMEGILPNNKYSSMEIKSSVKLDDDADELIMQFLDPYAVKLDSEVNSLYRSEKENKAALRTVIMSLASIIILFFAISASIINNTLAASIRENKREIGTLRAVGASSRELVMSYIKQLVSMFAWGYGLGFLASVLLILAMVIYSKLNGANMKFSIVVLPALIMCVLLFLICSLNLWFKVRKEMKNSIVENIREL